MVLTQALKQLKELQRKLEPIAVDTLKEHEAEFEDKLQEQHLSGLNADGEVIGIYRNPLYAQMKHSKNSRAGFGAVDLELSGDFHRSVKATATRAGVTLTASDSKVPELGAKYGQEEILGLSEQSVSELVNDVVRPYYAANVHTYLQNAWRK